MIIPLYFSGIFFWYIFWKKERLTEPTAHAMQIRITVTVTKFPIVWRVNYANVPWHIEFKREYIMIDKRVLTVASAIADIPDGAVIMVGGFGEAGSPTELIHALIDQGAKDLTIINNNTGNGEVGLAALIGAGQVKKMICSYPRSSHSKVFPELYRAGRIALEIVPQGTLAERIRAGGAGIPAFYTATTVGTPLAEGKEIRNIDGRDYVLEYGLTADYALIKAEKADAKGNLIYNKTARNFNPIMCTAAKVTIVQTRELVEVGDLDPEHIVTPNIYVNRVVEVAKPVIESRLIEQGVSYP